MTTISISPKFQIVIPKAIRETLSLRSGMTIEMIPYEDRIELIPIRPLKELRGLIKNIDTTITREKDRL